MSLPTSTLCSPKRIIRDDSGDSPHSFPFRVRSTVSDDGRVRESTTTILFDKQRTCTNASLFTLPRFHPCVGRGRAPLVFINLKVLSTKTFVALESAIVCYRSRLDEVKEQTEKKREECLGSEFISPRASPYKARETLEKSAREYALCGLNKETYYI